ncbi:MAG TPA: hypothetical protein VF515_07460 [Candidatus Binatia bacterium]|jgi:hypothetical protein
MHWLILLPYYFIGPMAALPFLILVARVSRLKVSINTLTAGAIVLSVAAIVVPLASGWLDPSAFTGRPLALLLLLSFLFAAVDAALAGRLPLSLDNQLNDL